MRIKEDNTATIRVLKKGYSSKLRHVLRTLKLNLGVVKEGIEDHGVQLEHVETDKQCTDIFTKDLAPMKWPNAMTLMGMNTSMGKSAGASTAAAANVSTVVEEPYDNPKVIAAPIVNNGVRSAVKLLDETIGIIKSWEPLLSHDDLVQASANVVLETQAASASTKSVHARPGGKLPGWGHTCLSVLCT